MSESLTDFATRVARYHRVPTGVVSSGDQTQAINSAVRTYSTRAPIERRDELTPNIDNEWQLSTAVTGWVDGWNVVGVLYEWGTGNLIPIDSNAWRVVRRGAVDYLRAVGVPSSADGIWLEYTRPHVVGATSGDTTIPAIDLDAVAKLAAAECCSQAAKAASDDKGSTFTADSVDHGAIARNWTDRQQELTAEYHRHMDARYPASGDTFVDWDSPGPYHSGSFWHNSRRH